MRSVRRASPDVGGRGRLLAAVGMLLLGFFSWWLWRSSTVVKTGRYNLVVVGEGKTAFVSIDPAERTIFAIPYPSTLAIRSRSVGEYEVGKLYTLGSYDGNPGEFARVKVQGFMKTLVHGYIVSPSDAGRVALIKDLLISLWSGSDRTSLSFLDSAILLYRVVSYDYRQVDTPDLLRAGVITEDGDDQFVYNEERLQQYVSFRIFDWGIGASELSAAVINESLETGLASDVSKFLENAGMDVVAVRSGQARRETTQVLVENEALLTQLAPLFAGFGWSNVVVGDTSQWRAQVVVQLGRDALRLF